MRLILSTSKPWHTNYCTEEGQVLYKVDSPWKLVNRTATIDKIVPNSTDSASEDAEPVMQDQFTRIVQIDFRAIEPSSTITFQDITQRVDSFFRKGKINWKAPDEQEYKWVMGRLKCELFLNDDARTPVAKYHLKHHGIIYPPGEHIVDHIIVTFVYLEKLRRDRQD
ncbi:hypothetical protein FA15DRAFT_682689 [Coprinopsis marcescibilis]|uniref:DUF6593 domain-containing protein n=1 Tax=Coprinopsis marcescibilis TaxID=230819 RepID=A0A5C3KIM3_COPMA|nr:hypothetical protein FA15DRAFT_682689 [Coprinopsis marcescibilis]